MDPELQARIRESGYEQLSTQAGTEALQAGMAQFLEQFGHLSDSGSDFSKEPWRENPDLILQMIINYVPYEGSGKDKVRFTDLQLSALRRPLFKLIYNRARRFQWYREAVSSLYTLGYGLFRDYFSGPGRSLCAARHYRREG